MAVSFLHFVKKAVCRALHCILAREAYHYPVSLRAQKKRGRLVTIPAQGFWRPIQDIATSYHAIPTILV